MRTLIIIAGGLVLLGAAVFAGGRLGDGDASVVTAMKVFIAVWLAAAAVNLWMGVARAGYSIGEELPIFLVIFLIPGTVAAFVAWKYSQV